VGEPISNCKFPISNLAIGNIGNRQYRQSAVSAIGSIGNRQYRQSAVSAIRSIGNPQISDFRFPKLSTFNFERSKGTFGGARAYRANGAEDTSPGLARSGPALGTRLKMTRRPIGA
jgi:hypothetical protein